MSQEMPASVEARPLSEFFRIPNRFHRSVHLSRDRQRKRGAAEYLVTGAIAETAGQILDELSRPEGTRAWTLTGPYGSGKSAFLLFLTDLLASRDPYHPEARSLRRERLPESPALRPILLQAEAAPLAPALTAALADSGIGEVSGRARALSRRREPSGSECAGLLAEAAAASGGGLMVAVDELGKYLEHAAGRNEEDIFLLQQLAEAAARSEKPLLLIGALHSGFSDYLSGSRADAAVQRAEWQKVQGRFHDLPFALPNEQVLDLVGKALRSGAETLRRGYAERTARIAAAIGPAVRRGRKTNRLAACAPLHPITALLLWPLFRSKAAQNERSLFTFLTSHEPFGFREFLHRETAAPGKPLPFFRLPELHDYAADALGSAAFTGAGARHWSLMAQALERVPADAPPLAAGLVKAVGLLSLYGEAAGLRADRETLEAVFDDREEEAVTTAIEALSEASIVLFRRHRHAFGLWEGSDIDLDAAFERAIRDQGAEPLFRRLRRVGEPRPVAARAHSVRGGTLRWFETRLSGPSEAELAQAVEAPTEADGLLLFVVGRQPEAAESARRASRAADRPRQKPVLAAAPHSPEALADCLDEVEGWQWVRDNTPELGGDDTARREVEAREEAARRRFERNAGPTLGLGGHVLDPSRCDWFVKGEKKRGIAAPRRLQQLLSRIFDDAYDEAPPLHNELLARRNLSSAAAAGRRNLIERIVSDTGQERLSIEGFGPEYSMFCSLVEAGGFRRRGEHGALEFGAPREPGWQPVWKAISDFVEDARDRPRPLSELVVRLESPPFGLPRGPFPVWMTLFLKARGASAALYEDGMFVPGTGIETLERLTRRPETFAIRSFRFGREERAVLRAVSRKFDCAPSLVLLARNLVGGAVRLSPYARQTKRISDAARRVRDELLTARDPRDLLLRDLPAAVGIRCEDEAAGGEFASKLREAAEECREALPQLLERIEAVLGDAFGIPERGEELRRSLRERARQLAGRATDDRLRQFLEAAGRTEGKGRSARPGRSGGPGGDWRAVLALPLAGGLPPERWTDDLAAAAEARLRLLAGEVERIEGAVRLSRPANADALFERWRRDVEAAGVSGLPPGECRKAAEQLAAFLGRRYPTAESRPTA